MINIRKAGLRIIGITFLALFSFATYGQNKDSLLQILPSVKNEAERIRLIYSVIDPDVNNLQEILVYNKKLLKLTRQQNDKVGEAYVTGILAYALSLSGNTAAGTELQFKALKMAEETGSQQVIGVIYNMLGVIYMNNPDYKERYYYKALKASTAAQDTMIILFALGNLTSHYTRQGKLDSALYFNQRAMEVATAQKKPMPLQFVHAGHIYYKLGQKKLALEYYHTALQEANRITDKRKKSFYRNYGYAALSRYFLAEARPDSALHYAQLYYQDVKDFYFYRQMPALNLLWKAYEKTNPDSALKYATQYYAVKDSMYSVGQLQQMQALSILEEERQLKAAAERKHNLQYAALAFGILTLLIGFLVLSHSVLVSQKFIRFLGVLSLLLVFEFLNLLLHPWLGAVTHHTPVLMLLFMVCIAALLVPLHHKIEHWIIHRLVEKNKTIRLAAAKKTIAQLDGDRSSLSIEKSTNAQHGL